MRLTLLLVAASCPAAAAGGKAALEPPSWNHGVRPQHFLIEKTVRVVPPLGARARIEFVQVPCACLKAKVVRVEGTADSPPELRVTMDTEELLGRTRRWVFVQLAEPDGRMLRFEVTGWVMGPGSPGRTEVFYAETEPAGERFLEWWKRASPRAEREDAARILLRPIEELKNYKRLRELEREAKLKGPACDVIAFVDAKLALKGEAEVEAGLSGLLNLGRDGRPALSRAPAEPDASGPAPRRKRSESEGEEGEKKEKRARRSRHAPAREAATGSEKRAKEIPGEAGPGDGRVSASPAARLEVELCYFSSCRRCREVVTLLGEIAGELGGKAVLTTKDMDLDPDAIPELYAQLRLYGGVPRVLPSMILFVGDRVVLGEEAILEEAGQAVTEQLARGGEHLLLRRPSAPAEDAAFAEGIGLVTVIAAALADGVNPCAFAAMVLLVSVLSARDPGERRKALLVGGASFVIAVFATYFLIGLGLFAGARELRAFPLAERVVFWAVWAVALAGGVLSGVDAAVYFRTGDPERIRLKVPEGLRKRFAPLLRRRFSSLGLVVGGIVGGFLISLMEGVCTGQMYLPTIQFMARSADVRTRWIAYLALYNALFVLPLVAILAAALAGVHFQRLNAFLRRHLGWTKVALAVVFFGLATVMFLGR